MEVLVEAGLVVVVIIVVVVSAVVGVVFIVVVVVVAVIDNTNENAGTSCSGADGGCGGNLGCWSIAEGLYHLPIWLLGCRLFACWLAYRSLLTVSLPLLRSIYYCQQQQQYVLLVLLLPLPLPSLMSLFHQQTATTQSERTNERATTDGRCGAATNSSSSSRTGGRFGGGGNINERTDRRRTADRRANCCRTVSSSRSRLC